MAGKDKTGREMAAVGRERVQGEKRAVEFDPQVHPGLVYRGLRLGNVEEVAAVMGIPVEMLLTWLEIHPELRDARARAQMRDTEILQSLEDQAIGAKDPETGRYVGGNPRLLMFLARTRLGMREPSQREDRDLRTPEELRRVATNLMRLLFANQKALNLAPEEVEYVDEDRGVQRSGNVAALPVADGSACFTQAGTP